MLWIHKFYSNELGYRKGVSGKAGRHIELPDTIAKSIYKDGDSVPLVINNRPCSIGFQDRPGKEAWLNKLTELDPDSTLLTPNSFGLFFILPEITQLIIVPEDNDMYNQFEIIFNSCKQSGNKYDAVTEQVHVGGDARQAYGVTAQLYKPFVLLAGISGSGKTRFIRKQAVSVCPKELCDSELNANYCLIPVRPDWHEPSDLLGYISRISKRAEYISTPLLSFIISAWLNAVNDVDETKMHLKDNGKITPFWLCLDEMNLAPIEQYFADYLSVLETRQWKNGVYSCDPLLKADVFSEIDDLEGFWGKLGLNDDEPLQQGLKTYFMAHGISLPPNLIVAGTVNMDETTHGFSRKVIDRALTLDFGEFYPNVFDEFLEPQHEPKLLSFSDATEGGLVVEMASGQLKEYHEQSKEFLNSINKILKATPFELAYRALNEMHLAVHAYQPDNTLVLHAVWDDFLMQKILPRIEGDTAKLRSIHADGIKDNQTEQETDKAKLDAVYGKGSILHSLYHVLRENYLKDIWPSIITDEDLEDNRKRPDLLRVISETGKAPLISCRSEKKLRWMMKRLKANHFTDFWA